MDQTQLNYIKERGNKQMEFNQIQKANEALFSINLKGKDYTEVNQRIKAFRMCCPNGTITTEILSLEDGVVTMKATIIGEDGKLLATGLAQEKENSTFINKTSFIENAETSAVGRALGFCGFGIDTSVASAEEVENAIANQDKVIEKANQDYKAVKETRPIQETDKEQIEKLITQLQEAGKSIDRKAFDSYLVKKYAKTIDTLTHNQASEIMAMLSTKLGSK